MAYLGRPGATAPLTSADIPDGIVVAADLAPNSVDSSELVDGSIDTSHIGDNQVTLAKMAGGTDGQIITYDASGDPVAVGPGTDGQILTSTGAGSPPAFESFPAGHVVKRGSVQTQALVTGSTAGPYLDDTIPQNTEGDQVLSLAFTPTSATNKLEISVKINGGVDGGTLMGALFQDSTANALASCLNYVASANTMYSMGFDHTMVAGTTSSTTFKVRVGSQISHTISLNGVSGGRIHGGSCVTSMIIKEIKV